MPEYIARISYGKDSLKMLDVIHSRGLPLDRITTTDVWATDTISANLPPVEEFKAKMDQWIWDRYRIEVEHLCARNKDGSKKTYEQMFYHVPCRRSQTVQVERERESRFRFGSILGFPDLWNPWCQAALKRNSRLTGNAAATGARSSNMRGFKTSGLSGSNLPLVQETQNRLCQNRFSEERPTRRGDINIVEYLGIAADEPKRHGQLNEKKRAPLVDFDIDEDLCGLYCQYEGILSPTYETSCRDGCWFCHNQGVKQLRLLRKNYPDLWALLMKWDKDSPVTFKADGHTVHSFDRRFQMEDEGLIYPDDKVFRWSMLDAELNYRLF